MAYTAPNDLFTSEEAILSLASSIADEDRTNLGNGTINGALDVLADALADQNVEVPPMNAGAILALADYVSGGGGSSDFSTATVTLNRAEGFAAAMKLQCARVASEPGATTSSAYSEDTSYEFTAVLYKGKALAFPPYDGVALSITGDATYDSDLEIYVITGDCTFTFADA